MPSLGNNLELTRASLKNRWSSHFHRVLLSAAGAGSRLSILIYHRVLPQRDLLFPTDVEAQTFDEQIGHLRSCFNIIPLAEAVQHLQAGSLPARAACITFDDGYADNANIALPILLRHGVSATFFVATNFLNGGRMWNDTVIELVRRTPGTLLDLSKLGLGTYQTDTIEHRKQALSSLIGKLKYLPLPERQEQVDCIEKLVNVALPDDLMMTSAQVRRLYQAGMEIGGHTVNHPILARLSRAEARNEIWLGKKILEDIINGPVRLFAYPNGKPHQDYLADHVDIAKELGFSAAVTTAWGAARAGDDLYQLPRFTPWEWGRTRFTMRMAQNMLRRVRQVESRG